MSDEVKNPLAEAQADSLDEAFARFDKHVSERTLRTIPAKEARKAVVEALRKQREAWRLAEAAGAKRMPKAKKQSDTKFEDIAKLIGAPSE